MNQDIIKAVEEKLGAAQDDLYRASAAFLTCSDRELGQEHGESGKTRRQIIEEYRGEVLRWQTALAEAHGK